ncbi:MAG TPA: Ig-like domain-containing protein [Stellaceae bacterium]|nr:Ig-like domain-containing protein [Stellaceae bacterium]
MATNFLNTDLTYYVAHGDAYVLGQYMPIINDAFSAQVDYQTTINVGSGLILDGLRDNVFVPSSGTDAVVDTNGSVSVSGDEITINLPNTSHAGFNFVFDQGFGFTTDPVGQGYPFDGIEIDDSNIDISNVSIISNSIPGFDDSNPYSSLGASDNNLAFGQHYISINLLTATTHIWNNASITLQVTLADPDPPTALTLDPADNTGNVPSENFTKFAAPKIDGTGAAGDTISLYDGTAQIGTGTVGQDGSWQITTPTLADGAHTLTATQTNSQSDVSSASAPLVINIKTSAPAAPSGLEIDPASDSGGPGSIVTKITQPAIDGQGEAGDEVALYQGNSQIGAGVVDQNGNWQITPIAPFTDGTYPLRAQESDAANNLSPLSTEFDLTINTTPPPTPTGLALDPNSASAQDDNLTDFSRPKIDGQALRNGTVDLFDGATHIGSAVVDEDGNWQITSAPLVNGPHVLTATVTNTIGNVSVASAPLDLTVDAPSPPAPTGLALDATSDSGVQHDNTTDVSLPKIDGQGVAGDIIDLYDGTTLVGTGTVAQDGTWQVTTSTLAIGSHSLTATDSVAGQTSVASTALGLEIASRPTAPSDLTLDPVSDSGVTGDNITGEPQPLIDGQGEAGDTVSLYDGGSLVGTGTVGQNGSWQITTSTLSAGSHPLSATETTALDTSVASSPITVTLDIPNQPLVNQVIGASNVIVDHGVKTFFTTDTQPVIAGFAGGVGGDTIDLYDGTTLIGTGTVTQAGIWQITAATLSSGAHSITATEIDVHGIASAPGSPALGVVIEGPPAAPSGLTLDASTDSGVQGDGITNITQPKVDGQGIDGDAINLHDGTTLVGTGTVAQDGTWQVTTSTLTPGTHSLTATQTDAAGNTSGASTALNLAIDTGPPPAPSNLTLDPATDSGVLGDGITNVLQPKIDGQGIAGDTISLYDGTTLVGTGTVAQDGAWQIAASTLAPGTHSLTATQTDVAGSTSVASTALNLAIDTGPPPAPSNLTLDLSTDSGVQGDDITNATQPRVDGQGIDGDMVDLYDGTTLVGTGTVAQDGAWQIAASTLAPGTHSLTATQTDVAGNTSVASTPLNLAIDAGTPPAPSNLTLDPATDSGVLGDDATSYAQPTIDGHGEAGDAVTLTDADTVVGSGTVGGTGDWQITTGALALGAQSLTATETDAAGNASGTSTALDLTIEPAPVGPSAPNQFFYSAQNDQFVVGTSGPDSAWTNASGDLFNGLGGNDFLGATGNGNNVDAGDGQDIVFGIGDNDTLFGGNGDDDLYLQGADGLADGGAGNDTIWGFGNSDTISGGLGDDTIGFSGGSSLIDGGTGNNTIFLSGSSDTVTGGGGNNTIYLGGADTDLTDGPAVFNDTVVGFSQATGDRIHLTSDTTANALLHSSHINGGLDTQINLSNGSAIVLKFVAQVDISFFN